MTDHYEPPSIAVRLHDDVPHIDWDGYHISHTFAPQNQEYQEALSVMMGTPVAAATLILLALSLYLCCNCLLAMCCGWERRTHERAKLSPRCPIVTQTVLLVGAMLACGLGGIGNSDITAGVDDMESALDIIRTDVDLAASTADNLIDVAEQSTAAVGALWGDCPTSAVGEIDQYIDDVNDYAESIRDVVDGIPDPLSDIKDWMHTGNEWRAVAMTLPLGLTFLCFVVACLANWKRSPCLARTFAGMAMWTLLALGVAVGAELMVSVAGADYCMDPDAFALDNIPDDALDVATYYVTCEGSNPIGEPLLEAQQMVDEAFSLVDELPASQCGQAGIDALVGNLSYARVAIDNAEFLTNCSSMNDAWVQAVHEGFCINVTPGLAWMWIAQAYCFFALMVSVLVAPVAWRRFSYVKPDMALASRVTVNVNTDDGLAEPLLVAHQRAAEQGMAGQHTVVRYSFGKPPDSGPTPGVAGPRFQPPAVSEVEKGGEGTAAGAYAAL